MALIDAQVDTVTDFDVYGPTLTLSTGARSMAQATKRLEHDFDDGRQRERQQPTFSLSGYFFNDISMFEQKKI